MGLRGCGAITIITTGSYIMSQHNIIIFKKVRMIDGHWWLSKDGRDAFSMELVNKSRL